MANWIGRLEGKELVKEDPALLWSYFVATVFLWPLPLAFALLWAVCYAPMSMFPWNRKSRSLTPKERLRDPSPPRTRERAIHRFLVATSPHFLVLYDRQSDRLLSFRNEQNLEKFIFARGEDRYDRQEGGSLEIRRIGEED